MQDKTTKHLIGNRISDLFERKTLELGGLDQGELFILLETGQLIFFPVGFDAKITLIDETEMAGAISILSEVFASDADLRIKDIIELDYSEALPYIELQCGLLFTEESLSPHGTGIAGFRSFESLAAFEAFHGKQYKRLSEV